MAANGSAAGASPVVGGGNPAAAEPDADLLEAELLSLPATTQRAVLALLGVCVGDSVGLPFELSKHRANRARADQVAESCGPKELQRLVLELVVGRLGRNGASSPYDRTFSDDTVCTDLKMAAIAQCVALRQRKSAGFDQQDVGDLLWRCCLAQMLAWARGRADGSLFQGYGGFTKGLLRPDGKRGVNPCLDIGDSLPGCDTWPDEWYVQHAENYCAGSGRSPASYGNGAVMSYAPQVLAILSQAAAVEAGGADVAEATTGLEPALPRLAGTHRHEDAVQGAELLEEVLTTVVSGTVSSCVDLRQVIRESSRWRALMASPLAAHPVYPLQAFNAFLANGDCSAAEVAAFVRRLTGVGEPPLAPAPTRTFLGAGDGAFMGQLLRTCANWDDDFGGEEGRLAVSGTEPVRFSQRALNSVLIALWCCCGARFAWDWIARLIYVGGDADTVGAVCGQIASPLLPPSETVALFRRYALFGDCHGLRPCAQVASASACRYFRRALWFCTGRWRDLAYNPRLVDPVYLGLTDDGGTRAQDGAQACSGTIQALWVDKAITGAGHLGRTEGNRRFAVEQAARNGLLVVTPASTFEQACDELQMARHGLKKFNVVVTELHVGRNPQAGLELLQQMDSFWHDAPTCRPTYVLLTTRWDPQLVDLERRYSYVALVRHDRPDAILHAVLDGKCSAALVPDELPPLESSGAE